MKLIVDNRTGDVYRRVLEGIMESMDKERKNVKYQDLILFSKTVHKVWKKL